MSARRTIGRRAMQQMLTLALCSVARQVRSEECERQVEDDVGRSAVSHHTNHWLSIEVVWFLEDTAAWHGPFVTNLEPLLAWCTSPPPSSFLVSLLADYDMLSLDSIAFSRPQHSMDTWHRRLPVLGDGSE